MKILHTADIHLREYQDERWEALQILVDVGRENNIDILAICGDLFDKNIDAENLRPRIRELFSNISFEVLLLPGNHDSDSYKSGMYFGRNVRVLAALPFEQIELGGVRLTGLPFEPIQEEQVLTRIRALSETLKPDKTNILLCHGELLDAFFSRTDFGAEGEGRYMPLKLSYFEGLNLDYVLAGHFHSNWDVWQLANGGYFVYPGSPVSITRREIGQRQVNLFEVGSPPTGYALDTFHFQEITVEFDPFGDTVPLEIVEKHFEKAHPKAKVILNLRGYINSERVRMTEEKVVALVTEIAKGRCAEPHYEFSDISRILESDLFKSFTDKARESGYAEEDIKRLQYVTIRAMMRAGL